MKIATKKKKKPKKTNTPVCQMCANDEFSPGFPGTDVELLNGSKTEYYCRGCGSDL
jgi:hypothetical protein